MSSIDDQQDKRNDLAWKIFLSFMMFLVTVCLAIMKSLWSSYHDINNRIIVIESSRCNAATCSSMRSDLVSLQSQITRLPATVPSEKEVEDIEEDVEKLKRDVWELQRRVSATEKRSVKH